MRYPVSSRFSYRNVLIAAGLAAALGVGSAYAKPATAAAPQPHGDGQTPEGTVHGNPDLAKAPGGIVQRGSRR